MLPDLSAERRPPQSAVRFTPVVKHSYLREQNGAPLFEVPWGKAAAVRLSLQNFNRHRKKRSMESEYGPYLQKSKAGAPKREQQQQPLFFSLRHASCNSPQKRAIKHIDLLELQELRAVSHGRHFGLGAGAKRDR